VTIYSLRKGYLISYDIENNKIRSSIFKELEKHGLQAVQKSVFWGYLTLAELRYIKRYLNDHLEKFDKVFITHTRFDNKNHSYFIGHKEEDFKDWKESDVI